MNTTDETSEFTSPQTNMAPTTTFAKGKKGVVVLVALCLMFFYTGRLSSSSGGGASLDASLLRGFHQDVGLCITDRDCGDKEACGLPTLPGFKGRYCKVFIPFAPCAGTFGNCTPVHDKCKENTACRQLLKSTSTTCDCDCNLSCIIGAFEEFGSMVPIEGNDAIDNLMECIRRNWQNYDDDWKS